MKLGDAIASLATPIARSLGMSCIDPETNQLRPESDCAKRRARLNDFSDSFYDYFFHPEQRNKGDKMKFTLQMSLVVEAEKAEDVLNAAKPGGGELISFSVQPRIQSQLSRTQVPVSPIPDQTAKR